MVDGESPKNVDEYRQQLRSLLDNDSEALFDLLYTSLLQKLPDYVTGADRGDDIRATVRLGTKTVMALVFDDAQSFDRAAWRAIGAQRARRGLPRATLETAAHVLRERGFGFLLSKARTITGPGSLATTAIHEVWNGLQSATDAVIEALLAGWDNQRTRGGSEDLRPQSEVVDRILRRHWDDREDMAARARRAGLDVSRHHGVLVLFASEDTVSALASAGAQLRGELPDAVEGPLLEIAPPSVALLVPAPSADDWRTALRSAGKAAKQHHLTIVTIDPVDPLEMLHTKYLQLLDLARLLQVAAPDPGTATVFDLQYHASLCRIPPDERKNVVEEVLGPVLASPKKTQYLELLDALYRTQVGKEEARQRLGIHTNTFRNWVKEIEDLTKLSLGLPGEAHRLFTALVHTMSLPPPRNGWGLPQDSS